MTILLIILHVVVCILLITLVLIQRGRGSGLVESFAGVESMFGTKTNAFLTRTTTVLSIVFFFTCLSLAIIAVRQSKSLLANVKPAATAASTATAPAGQTAAAAQQAPKADQK
ncbi:MAG: preprotein translocase subunit SecG [Candidatus Omnitrophica bacterium]|nr:preprotein translocase subunit SecG [Candidatus Omnitrophota bacterium]